MKVQEFVEVVNNSKNKALKGALSELLIKTLEPKKYIGIKEKRALIDDIIGGCILYEDGVYKFDDIDKYIAFTMKTIAAYTNLELSDDMENDYDELCKANLLNSVIETFGGEYENVSLLLQMKCEYILNGNNIESQIGRFLTGIAGKVGDFADALADRLGSFDLGNLPINMDDLGKLIEFVNSQKK
jgi:hypothetical protein